MAEAHKHAELICAWANGAEIEYYSSADNDWLPTSKPEWSIHSEYRIAKKPEPPLEVTLHASLDVFEGICTDPDADLDTHNLKLYFDPTSHELIKAEVI